ncbi:MAG: hypothetical protein ACK52E_16450 [Aphanizomenon sp.]|jgi:hypothetical protein
MDSKTFNLLRKLLSRPVAFHRIFASIGGGATEGLFLSQAYYWSQHTKDPEGWFYKTSDEWNEETALTRREQETARKSLRELGILREKRKGHPAKLFYQVDVERLYELIYESSTPNSQIAKSDKLDDKIAKSDKQDCHFLQTRMSDVTNKNVISDELSIYTKTTTEITTEITPERRPEESPPIEVELFPSGSDLNEICFFVQTPELPKTKNLKSWQNSAAPLMGDEATADRVRRKYQETGILPSIPMEFESLAQEDLGTDLIASYRKSGRVTTAKLGDIHPEFANYVASQWKGKDIDYGYSYILTLEKDPRKWETLGALVIKWQASKSTNNHNLNITQEIDRASKPVVDFGGIRL